MQRPDPRTVLISVLAATAISVSLHADAQNPQPAIVFQGGTLIDGNGGAPVPNAVIVVQGNRITAVGRTGQIQIPAGARVIDAAGKWITPGLIDAKSNYYSVWGEGYLIWGVTALMESGGKGDVGTAERDAINHGIFEGPRLYNAVAVLNGPGPDGRKVDGTVPGRGGYVVRTPEQAREMARTLLDAGADFLTVGDGDGDPSIFAPIAEEANRAGKANVWRLMGPQTRAREGAALAPGLVCIHTCNVGTQIAKDPEKWKAYIGLPPDPYSDMDEAKVPEMIRYLVERNVVLEPDLMATARGFPKNWKRVQEENARFFDDRELMAYYPLDKARALVENAKNPETYLTPAALDVRKRGFQNHMIFLKRYVDAGGKIVAASDIPQVPPGLGLHQEMSVFVEDVGLTPMQAIQSATKWVADAFKQPDIGSIEVGKLADLVVVTSDPTRDILNLRKIDMVMKDGKIVDRKYHSWYRSPFGNYGVNGSLQVFGNPVIEDAARTAAVKTATWRPDNLNGGFNQAGGIDSELAPTPGIESIAPYTVLRGSPAFVMTIRGFNFVNGSRVFVDDIPVPVRIASRTEIHATIDQNLISRAGRFGVYVKNPEPLANKEWGGASNRANLLVPFEFTTKFSRNRF